LGTTDGLSTTTSGFFISYQPIVVPVGSITLGRILNVTGSVLDPYVEIFLSSCHTSFNCYELTTTAPDCTTEMESDTKIISESISEGALFNYDACTAVSITPGGQKWSEWLCYVDYSWDFTYLLLTLFGFETSPIVHFAIAYELKADLKSVNVVVSREELWSTLPFTGIHRTGHPEEVLFKSYFNCNTSQELKFASLDPIHRSGVPLLGLRIDSS